jgi:asparagine synthase (glutamine-hydrolysing)
MAAIYGVLGAAHGDELHAMGRRLLHRGTTPREWSPASDVVFGFRFLADDSDEGLADHALVFDGFLDNVEELLDHLGERGGAASWNVPAIVRAIYQRFGTDGFAYLAGHFALALWDEAKNGVILARDRYGARPLTYAVVDGCAVFASEYKALLALPDVPARPDLDAIQYLQCTKFAPPDATFLRDVRPVPPGQWILLRRDQRTQAAPRPYWSVAAEPDGRNADALATDLRERVLDATARQSAPYDPIGVSLSGGLDSAIAVAALRQVAPEKTVHTFCGGFGPEDREIVDAGTVARHFGTDHHEVVLDPLELPNLLPEIVWYLEEPAGREETAFLYVTSREARNYVTMLLAGYGADLLFAGMPRHFATNLALRYPVVREPLGDLLAYTQSGAPPRSFLGNLLVRAYFRGSQYPAPRVLGAGYAPRPADLTPTDREPLTAFLLDVLARESVESKTERLHSCFGLSFNAPFMDPTIIDCARRIPDRLKIRSRVQKYILREAFRPLLPEAVLRRKKTLQKLRHDAVFSTVLEDLAEQYLAPPAVAARGLFDPKYVADVVRRSTVRQPYSSERAYRIWSLLMTEIWCRTFLDHRGATPLPVPGRT